MLLLVIRSVVVYCYFWWHDSAVGCVVLLLVAWCGAMMFMMSCWRDVTVLMVLRCRGVVMSEYCGVVTIMQPSC